MKIPQINSKALRIFKIAAPIFALAPGLILILYYIIGPAAGYMTSDCTDSLRWAQATLESGKLISDEFYYAAILPFGGNLIFLPFVAMFGYSLTAQICGLVVFVLLFAAALYYLARGMNFDRTVSAAFVSVVLLIMSSSPKLREIMWEHIFYYNLGLLFFCFGFGLALRILRKGGLRDDLRAGKPIDWVRIGIICVFSLIAATDGLQTMVCFTLPLVAGLFAERFFDTETPLPSKRNLVTGILAAVVLVFSLIGFVSIDKISGGVTAGYADAYSAWSAMSSWTDNFLGFFHNWFTLLGVDVVAGDPLVSGESIVNMIRIFGALLLLIAPIILVCRYNKIQNSALRAVLIGHFAVTAFILFAITFGKLGGANWRLVPMLGTSVMTTFFAAVELIRQKKAAGRIGALILAFLILMACIPARDIAKMPADYGEDNSWHTVARELEAHGLKYGYANFWWAEVVTMISGGEVVVANLSPSQRSPQQYNYQQPYGSYDDKDTDRYFLMLTESENSEMSAWLQRQRAMDKIVEEFTIISEPYDLRGYKGEVMYVYVFAENIF